jgi:hypothetical protein
MQISMPDKGQVIAFGRHAVSYSAGAISAAVMLHALSPSEGSSATNAITQISTGVASIAAGVTTLVSIAMGIWAALKSGPFATLLSASKVIGTQGQIVLKDAKLAAALPANVVASSASALQSTQFGIGQLPDVLRPGQN